MSGASLTLEGVIQRFVFQSDDGAYAVARFRPDGADLSAELLAAVGPLCGLEAGERVRLHGRHEQSPKYGPQFRVEAAYPVLPHTVAGIRGYLGSGKVEGVGAGLAARLVHHFGEATLDVIEQAPDRLAEVPGIGPIRSRHIQRAFASKRSLREALVFLQGHQVSGGLAGRIWRRYQEATIATVRENPYRLAEEVRGVGFATADRIARALGFARDAPARAAAALVHLLLAAGGQGHVFLPQRELLAQADRLLGNQAAAAMLETLVKEERLVREPAGAPGDRPIYLPADRQIELACVAGLIELLGAPVPALDLDAFEHDGPPLAPLQEQAITQAASERGGVLLLTGGPGTGKTTVLRAVVRLFEANLEGKVELAAPTGRAAQRMAEATGRPARTLHRLLEFSPREGRFTRDAQRPLEAAAVIVDEASMVDQALLAALLDAIVPGTRLLLVGDADQLPSVGPGNVLRDCLASERLPTVRLKEIFRQASESAIVTNAHRILRGAAPLASDTPASDFFWIQADHPERALELIERLVAERIPNAFGLRALEDVQVLTPMRRGACGIHRLNQVLRDRLNPTPGAKRDGLRLGDKVMQIRNDYEKDVFNGDIGRVVGSGEGALEVAFDQGRRVRYEGGQADALTLAYACTVHKSQGSEYPAVIMPLLTEHWVMLQRNLLYTAVTRGKRLVVLVGQRKALDQALRSTGGLERFTRLGDRLRSAS